MSNSRKVDSLPPKQAAFAHEYRKDRNGKQAAIRAGYSEKTAAAQAVRLLTKVNVAEAIAELDSADFNELGVTAKEVIEEYRKMAFADPDYFDSKIKPADKLNALAWLGKLLDLNDKEKTDASGEIVFRVIRD